MKLGSDLSAVVVGGASGLGEAVVRALRAYEVRVAILDLNVRTKPWTGACPYPPSTAGSSASIASGLRPRWRR